MQRRDFVKVISAAAQVLPLVAGPEPQSRGGGATPAPQVTAGRADRPFYETCYRGFVIDLASPDPPIVPLDRLDQLQINEYERLLKLARIDNTFVYCKDHWGNAYYNTVVGKKHGGLKIDYVGEIAKVLRRNRIAFIAYYSVGLDNHVALTHADWAVTDEDGSKRRILAQPPPKFYWACMNSPYRQYVLDQIREIVLGYRPDAVFLDLYGQTLCYCNHCQKEFRSRTGLLEIPKGDDRRVHRKLLDDFVYQTIHLEPLREIAHLVKSLRPGTALVLNGGYAFHRREVLELTDYTIVEPMLLFTWFPHGDKKWEWYANDLVPTLHDNLLSGIFCRGLGKFPQLVPGSDSLVFDPQNSGVLRAAIAETIASGCRGSRYADCQNVDGSLEPHLFELLGEAYADVEKFQDQLLDRDPIKSVALVYSENSRIHGPGTHMTALYGALVAGAYSLYPVDVLPEWEIKPENLASSQLVILPEVACLSLEAANTLRDYVARGGNLIATMRTGLLDEKGAARSDFLLADVFGCRFERLNETYMPNEWGSFLHRESQSAGIWRGLPRTELGMLPPLAVVTPTQGEVLAWHKLPVTVLTGESWVNWWSPHPQLEASRLPAVIRNQVGKGQVFYCSFDLFRMLQKSFLWPGDFFVNLLRDMVPQPPIRVISQTTGVLGATFFRRRKNSSLMVHLLNLTVWPLKGRVIPISGGAVAVSHEFARPRRCRQIYPLVRDVSLKRSEIHTSISMPDVEIHSIFEIEI